MDFDILSTTWGHIRTKNRQANKSARRQVADTEKLCRGDWAQNKRLNYLTQQTIQGRLGYKQRTKMAYGVGETGLKTVG